MTEQPKSEGESEVIRFIVDQIDSVPQLEALLLVWNTRPAIWTPEDLGKRLYVSNELGHDLLQELVRKRLITGSRAQSRDTGTSPCQRNKTG